MADRKTKIIIETESGNSEQKLKNIAKDLKGISSEAKSTSTSVGQSTTAMMGKFIALGAKVAAVTATIKKAYSMAREAAEFQETVLLTKSAAENIGLSFERLAEASKRGADGMADAATIMKTNLKALKLGLNATEEEFGRLWEIANATGDELGQSIEQTFEQIVHAINTGNSRALVQLGVLPENFKKAANSADLLSSKADLLKTVLDQLGKSTDRVNSLGNTAADKFQQFENACSDLSLTVKENLVPALTPIVEVLTEIIKTATKASNALAIVFGMKESKNPYLAYSKDDLISIQNQKRNEISQYRYYADIVSGKSNTPLQSLSQSQRAEIFGVNKYNWASMAEAEEARLKQVEEALEHINKLEEKRLEIKKKQEEQNEKTKQAAANEAAQKEKEKAEREAEKRREKEEQQRARLLALQQRQQEEAERAFKSFANLTDSTMPQLIRTEEDAYQIALDFAKAAGGIAVGFDKAAAYAKELEQSESWAFTEKQAQNAGYWNSFIKKDNKSQITDLFNATIGMSGLSGINVSKIEIPEVAKKGWNAIKGQVIEGFSDAVTSGIINSNLGDALRGAISSIAAGKAQSYGGTILSNLFSGKGLSGIGGALSGFVGSIAVSAIANNWKKWFGSKNHAETDNKNRSTVERMANAFLSTYSAMLNPYITPEMENELWTSKQGSTYVGWRYKTDWKGRKTYYDDTPQATFDTIARVENAVKKIEEYNKEKERELDLLSAQGQGYKVLSEQVNALSGAMNRAKYMLDEYSFTFSGDVAGAGTYKIDLSENIDELKKAYYEALRQYGEETGARNQQKASTFLSLFPYLDDYDMGRWSIGRRHLGSKRIIEGNDNAGLAYGYISGAQENLLDRIADPDMLRMIQQAGLEQFNLASLQYTESDASKYTEAYLNVLERQKDAAEYVMLQQEQIYLDMTKTFEEQSAALDTYQQAQDQYYNTKLEILAQERAKEEQLKKEEQQARLRSADRMEALLGFTGEMARTNNKIYILEGADQVGALRELEQYIDDPEALSFVKRLMTAATNKNKYGKIA